LERKKISKKNDIYEYFKANANTVTSAQFFPRLTINMSADDPQEGNKITHMIVTSGYTGELKFFENRPPDPKN